jgi:hypothetical protein
MLNMETLGQVHKVFVQILYMLNYRWENVGNVDVITFCLLSFEEDLRMFSFFLWIINYNNTK